MPHGKKVRGKELEKDLIWIFEKHSKNAESLNPNGNTCTDESFNLVVAKAPKMHHYSKSESSTFVLLQRFAKKL